MLEGSGGLLYLGVLVIAFYLLIIRPQMQRTKQMRELMASLAIGDQVVTIGGLHGSIIAMVGTVVTLRVADGVELQFEKSAIARKDTGTVDSSDSGSADEDEQAPSVPSAE
jgi:preprotein translocase subunit YajC